MSSLVETGLTDMPKSGGVMAMAPTPAPQRRHPWTEIERVGPSIKCIPRHIFDNGHCENMPRRQLLQ